MCAAMEPFLDLVEQRIRDAERDGLFTDLPGKGRPLVLADVSGVPDELRAAYLVLHANGFVPPELEARKEWLRLEDLLAACADGGERRALGEAARRARLRYRLLMEQRSGGPAWAEYRDEVERRLGGAAAGAGVTGCRASPAC
jgi:hypothetical protein